MTLSPQQQQAANAALALATMFPDTGAALTSYQEYIRFAAGQVADKPESTEKL